MMSERDVAREDAIRVGRLAVIQPHLSPSSRETFLELSQYCPIDLVVSVAPKGSGFGDALPAEHPGMRVFVVPTLKPFGSNFGWIQWGLIKYILVNRPRAIFINANPRFLSLWTSLLWAALLGIPVYAHGHGFYRRKRISMAYRLMMTVLLKFVNCYICYAPIVRQAFVKNGFSTNKLAVAHNSLVNRFPVKPHEKTGNEQGVLFIGRLRQGNNLETLIQVMERLRTVDELALTLHVIGSGENAARLRQETGDKSWIVWHGEIYDPEKIRKISVGCFVGCYPGNAGLSVIHMMSLSLPVITHNDLSMHGPEPSLLRDGLSGLLFDHANSQESLYQAIKSLACDRFKVSQMREFAFADYQHLSSPSLAVRFWLIMSGQSARLDSGLDVSTTLTADPSEQPWAEVEHT